MPKKREPNADAVTDFWSLMDRLYRRRDAIRKSSDKIVDYAYQLHPMSDKDTFMKVARDDFDDTKLRAVLKKADKEMNAILSYAHELEPHLKNKEEVLRLSRMASALTVSLGRSNQVVVWNIDIITITLREFASSSNRLVLNPTKKSIEAAIGMRINKQWPEIAASIGGRASNF